jgi:hypothetical protein
MGVTFLCPHCRTTRIEVWFDLPLDGGPPIAEKKLWRRTGDSLETISLEPSINVYESDPTTGEIVVQHWHGHVRSGRLDQALVRSGRAE